MRTYKIIIVENDEDEQFFMKDGFEKAGRLFEIVAQVRNGDMLFEWLEQQNDSLPGVVLSDLNMPGMNGYDVITGMKSDPRYAKIPVIITSYLLRFVTQLFEIFYKVNLIGLAAQDSLGHSRFLAGITL